MTSHDSGAQCIAFAHYKGGTGKTTSCVSMAGILAQRGKRVLVVDFDPQANATTGLGIDSTTLQRSVYDALLTVCEASHEGVHLRDAIQRTAHENLDIAPAEFDLGVSELIMSRMDRRVHILRDILDSVRADYDYILVDLPSHGLLLLNGLCTADHVIVPVDPGFFAVEAVRQLKTTFDDVKQMAGWTIKRSTAIMTRVQHHGWLGRMLGIGDEHADTEAALRSAFQKVFAVPYSKQIYAAQKHRVPIAYYAPNDKATHAYARVVDIL
jgi:chromosome partitioning protein